MDGQYVATNWWWEVTQRTPAECLTAEVEFEGERYSLCLVKHHWSDEGTATIDHLTRDNNTKGEPRASMLNEHGIWSSKVGEDGERRLRLEIDVRDDIPAGAVNALLRALPGELWGLAGCEEWE